MPLTLVAGIGHWMFVIGSYFSVRVPDAVLRFTLATTLLLVAGNLAL